MKCSYDMCNNLGTCSDDFVKIYNRYYCKSCYEEKEGKVKIREEIVGMLPKETIRNVNTVVKDLIHNSGFDWKYILFTLKVIKRDRMRLNYARGIIYYLNNEKILEEYNMNLSKEMALSMKVSDFGTCEESVNYKSNKTLPKWMKLK